MITLVRSRVPNHSSLADLKVERTAVSGHPPLPGDLAQKALRAELHPYSTPAGEPIAWRHHDANAWAAVERLHRTDHHDEAVDLARLLRWTEQGYSHDQVHHWTLEAVT